MSKGKFRPPPSNQNRGFGGGNRGSAGSAGGAGGAGGMGGLEGLLAQAQKMQEEAMKVQENLGNETVTATAGGGAIEVVMTGHQTLQSIKIDPSVVDPQDVEMLQDLIVAVINDAVAKTKALSEQKMNALTGGLGLPGM